MRHESDWSMIIVIVIPVHEYQKKVVRLKPHGGYVHHHAQQWFSLED